MTGLSEEVAIFSGRIGSCTVLGRGLGQHCGCSHEHENESSREQADTGVNHEHDVPSYRVNRRCLAMRLKEVSGLSHAAGNMLQIRPGITDADATDAWRHPARTRERDS